MPKPFGRLRPRIISVNFQLRPHGFYEKIGDPIPEELPLNSIKTTSCVQIDSNTYSARGQFNKTAKEIQIIEAQIKPRATWIEYVVGQNKGRFNITSKEHWLSGKRHGYIIKALEKWLIDEHSKVKQAYENIRAEKKERRYKTRRG